MLAILRESGEVLYLDACTALNSSMSASVTKNPIDGTSGKVSSTVTDHIVVDNPTLKVSGVFSPYDFGVYKTNSDPTRVVVNPNTTDTNTLVTQTELDIRRGRLAGQSGQLNVISTYQVLEVSSAKSDAILSEILNRGEIVTVLVYNKGMVLDKTYSSMVMTGYSTDEDSTTGDSPNIQLTFEKIKVVFSKKVNVKIVDKKAASNKNGGKRDSKEGSGETESEIKADKCFTRYKLLINKILSLKDGPAKNTELNKLKRAVNLLNISFKNSDVTESNALESRIKQQLEEKFKDLPAFTCPL